MIKAVCSTYLSIAIGPDPQVSSSLQELEWVQGLRTPIIIRVVSLYDNAENIKPTPALKTEE